MKKNNPILKKALVALAIGALLAMMVAPAFGSVVTWYENDQKYSLNTQNMIFSGSSYVGEAVTGNGYYLTSAQFYLTNATTTVTGTLNCILWFLNSGTWEITEIATNTYDLTNLEGWTWITFTFNGSTQVTFGDTYVVAINGTASQNLYIGHYGNLGTERYETGTFATFHGSAHDLSGVFLTSTTAAGEEEGGGGGSGFVPTSSDEIITSLTQFIVPLIIILLPVLLLVTITRSTDKWIILIGLTIGVALGYFFALVPLWVVFLVVIGLIGMAYQSVKGGG